MTKILKTVYCTKIQLFCNHYTGQLVLLSSSQGGAE